MWKLLVILLAAGVAGAYVALDVGGRRVPPATVVESPVVAQNPAPDLAPSVDAAFRTFDGWSRSDHIDAFTDRRIVTFRLKARQAVPSPPFNRTATLVFRCNSRGLETYIYWGDVIAIDNAWIKMRVDAAPFWTEHMKASDDSMATGIWSTEGALVLARKLAQGKKLLASTSTALGRQMLLEFDVRGLGEMMAQDEETCPLLGL